MKKLFTILTVVALTTTISFAQAQFGAVAGLNISAIGSDATLYVGEEWGGSTGIHIGGVAHIPLGDVIQLRTGLIYSQKGGTFSYQYAPYADNYTFNLDYLEIPIEVAFVMGEVFALSAGPYIAFAMNKDVAIESTDPSSIGLIELVEAIYSDEIDKGVSGIDFGLNFGASFTIAESFLIGTKYSMGLTNILDVSTTSDFYVDSQLGYFPGQTWVNGCFSISFGYVFGY